MRRTGCRCLPPYGVASEFSTERLPLRAAQGLGSLAAYNLGRRRNRSPSQTLLRGRWDLEELSRAYDESIATTTREPGQNQG